MGSCLKKNEHVERFRRGRTRRKVEGSPKRRKEPGERIERGGGERLGGIGKD